VSDRASVREKLQSPVVEVTGLGSSHWVSTLGLLVLDFCRVAEWFEAGFGD
jgi:hypothetical protein